MENDRRPSGDGKLAQAANRGLDAHVAAPGVNLGQQIGRQGNDQPAVGVGLAAFAAKARFGLRVEAERVILIDELRLVAEDVARRAVEFRDVLRLVDVPVDRQPGGRPTEQVSGLDGDVGRLAAQRLGLVAGHSDLELRRAVLGHGEDAAGEPEVAGDVEGVGSEGHVVGQDQLAGKDAIFVERDGERLAKRVRVFAEEEVGVDRKLQFLNVGQDVAAELRRAHEALVVDGVARPEDGPVGVDVGEEGLLWAAVGGDAHLPGLRAARPQRRADTKTGRARLVADDDHTLQVRLIGGVVEAGETVGVGSGRAGRLAVALVERQVAPGGRLPGRQVGGPDVDLAKHLLDNQVGVADDQQDVAQLIVGGVGVDFRRADAQLVDAGRQHAAVGQVDGDDTQLVGRILNRDGRLEDRLTLRRALIDGVGVEQQVGVDACLMERHVQRTDTAV